MEYRLSARLRADASGLLSPVAPDPIEEAARHYRAGEYAQAARCCLDILERDTAHFDALHLLGVIRSEEGSFAAAADYLRRAAELRPADRQLRQHIAHAWLGLREFERAAAVLESLLEEEPATADLLSNLGNALGGQKDYAAAISHYHQALALDPDHLAARYNLGRALATLDRLEEAADCFRAVQARLPADAPRKRVVDVATGLADVLGRLGKPGDALALCEEVLATHPESAELEWNKSLALLSVGCYEEGWRLYEARWRVPDHDALRQDAGVLDLTTVADRRVLVIPEQGRGDILQFARYLPLLVRFGAKVSVVVYDDVKPLIAMLEGVEQVAGPDDAEPSADFITPIGSLPLAFRTTVADVPSQVPYLKVPAGRVQTWKQRLGERRRPRVGLAWRGLQHIPYRSVPVPALAPILAVEGVEFHALQKEITAVDREWLVKFAPLMALGEDVDGPPSRAMTVGGGAAEHGMAIGGGPARRGGTVTLHDADLRDFADTAALIRQLDLVITIDTSVAHLAGALGAPVWVMLAFGADWRWLTQREDSPWYPTARLFRQKRRGDWTDVVTRVAEALSAHSFDWSEHEVEGDQDGIFAAKD
jgi:tetratricopeptide (TPR) repeat protein